MKEPLYFVRFDVDRPVKWLARNFNRASACRYVMTRFRSQAIPLTAHKAALAVSALNVHVSETESTQYSLEVAS